MAVLAKTVYLRCWYVSIGKGSENLIFSFNCMCSFTQKFARWFLSQNIPLAFIIGKKVCWIRLCVSEVSREGYLAISELVDIEWEGNFRDRFAKICF